MPLSSDTPSPLSRILLDNPKYTTPSPVSSTPLWPQSNFPQSNFQAAEGPHFHCAPPMGYPLGVSSGRMSSPHIDYSRDFVAHTDASSDYESSLQALQASLSKLSCAADTACSLHCTGTYSRLAFPRPLSQPILLSGIGENAVYLTHIGVEPRLPVGHRNLYYGLKVSAELVSLGYLSRRGRCAFVGDVDGLLKVFFNGALLFTAPRQLNNLYTIDMLALHSHPSVQHTCTDLDDEYLHLHADDPAMITGLPTSFLDTMLTASRDPVTTTNLIKHTSFAAATSRPVFQQLFFSLIHAPFCNFNSAATTTRYDPIVSNLQPAAAYSSAVSQYQFNNEQRLRINMAEDLVRYLHWPSTEAVATGASMGAFSLNSPLEARDFHNLERAKGYSPHYLAGHFNQKSMKTPSVTPPAHSPGQVITMDIRKLSVPSINGSTHSIQIVSEFEGYIAIIPAKAASSKVLFDAIHSFIATTYNSQSHRVESAHADAESVMKSMKASFGSIGIMLTLSPPGQHAQRSERYTQTLDTRARSTLDSLPYELPAEFLLFLDMSVANTMNLVPNSRSFPLTPYEKVFKRRYAFHATHPFLPFGTVCSVSMGDAKRAHLAQNLSYPKHAVGKSEIGVLLGSDPAFPGSYIFYVSSTNAIVPRKVVKVLHRNTIPFNWKPKASIFNTLQQFPVDLSTSQDRNVLIQPSLNPDLELPPSNFVDKPFAENSSSVPPGFLPIPLSISSFNLPSTSLSVPPPPLVEPIVPSVAVTSAIHQQSHHPAVIVPPLVPPPPLVEPIVPSVAVTSALHQQSHHPTVIVPPLLSPPLLSPPFLDPVQPVVVSSVPPSVTDSVYTPVVSSTRVRPRYIVTPRESLPRAKKGIPYTPPGAYYTPAYQIYDNYHMPPLHGSLPKISRKFPMSSPVSRSRSYVPVTASRHLPEHFSSNPIVNDDDSWYTAPGSFTITENNTHENSAFTCAATPLSDYPLPPVGMERNDNIYQLPSDILNNVAFLSELTNPLDVPAGLRLPKSDMHEVPYAKALKDPTTFPRSALSASVAKEVSKLTDRYQALQLVTDSSQIEPDALFINGILLSKVKYLADGTIDRISTRFALNGTLQKEGDYGETYAATPDEAAMICCMSAFQAHAIKHNYV